MIQRASNEYHHLLAAIDLSLNHGAGYLRQRLAPAGPIMSIRHLSYVHKAVWGLYATGVNHHLLSQILDWVQTQALQPNGDFFFPEEGAEYQVTQRLYRPLTFGKVAVWIGHPLFHQSNIVNRILQYQHRPSGGVFHYIGNDPRNVEPQATIGCLNTSFFGHLMIALNRKAEAVAAGNWIRHFVEVNQASMKSGVLYTKMTPEGVVITKVQRGERISSLVNNQDPKQEFWQVGTCMAYLSSLYDALRERWNYNARETAPFLEAAFQLLAFEATMPLATYLWPSKCKVGWGVGELLRVLCKYHLGTSQQLATAYDIARKVAIFTFLDNQLPTGGWSCMHYPLADDIPELAYDYKPLKGVVNVPDQPIPDSATIFLPSEEITGEFLGEMSALAQGVRALAEGGQ